MNINIPNHDEHRRQHNDQWQDELIRGNAQKYRNAGEWLARAAEAHATGNYELAKNLKAQADLELKTLG